VRRAWPNAPTACVPRFPLYRLKGVQGEAVLTAIIGAADALSTAAGNGVLARNVAEDTLSGAMTGVLETYVNSTK
jgi:hypothetical protein